MTVALNHQRDAENFDGTEQTSAVFAMAEIYSGRWFVLPGVRYEYTAADFIGRDVRFASNGAWLSSNPLEATAHYGVATPVLHVTVRCVRGYERSGCGDAVARTSQLL